MLITAEVYPIATTAHPWAAPSRSRGGERVVPVDPDTPLPMVVRWS